MGVSVEELRLKERRMYSYIAGSLAFNALLSVALVLAVLGRPSQLVEPLTAHPQANAGTAAGAAADDGLSRRGRRLQCLGVGLQRCRRSNLVMRTSFTCVGCCNGRVAWWGLHSIWAPFGPLNPLAHPCERLPTAGSRLRRLSRRQLVRAAALLARSCPLFPDIAVGSSATPWCWLRGELPP